MSAFLAIVLSFPTVIATVLLGIAMLYWGFVIIGALDIEMLEVGDGLLDGALDGVDSAIEGMDAAVDAAEGAVDGAVEDLSGATGGIGGPLLLVASVFRLGRVPVTVSGTAWVLWAWVLGFALTWFAGLAPAVLPTWAASTGILVGSWGLGAALTNVSVRPLEGLFTMHSAREKRSLVGEVCQVTTGRVDDRFGQGTAQVGSDDLLFQVRCDKPNAIRRGDLALIVHYDRERDAYVVEPMAALKTERDRNAQPASLPNPALVNKEV